MNLLKELVSRIGRRGSFLLFLAELDFLYGWALYTQISPRRTQSIDLLFSLKVWSIIWMCVGTVCLIQAFAKNDDRVAFTCAGTLKVCWAFVLFYSWAFTRTDPHAWPSVVFFLTFAGLTTVVSYWPERRPFILEDLDDTE